MHYIIQEDIFKEPHYKLIRATLDRLNLPYQVVRIFPFVNKIVETKYIPIDNNFDMDELPELIVPENTKIFVFGAVKLAHICSEKNWYPGSRLNKNHDFEVYSEYYKDNLLNYDSKIMKASEEIIWDTEDKFIRPTKDTKSFNGKVYNKHSWANIIEKSEARVLENTIIQVSSVKYIYKEIRFWVINGKIITGSQYILGKDVIYDSFYEEEALNFAQNMVDVYQIADAFVIDVCLTENGWKIVECNCINCAGFYLSDVQKMIMELEYFFNPEKFEIKNPSLDGPL